MTSFNSNYPEKSHDSIGLSFIKVYHTWHKLIKDALKKLDLTHPQFVVLASLGYLSQTKDEVNQKEIADQSDIDVMTVSTIIRNLEKAKLLSRQDSTRDTRAKAVLLTKQGKLVLAKALPLVESIDTLFFSTLQDDQDSFNELLHRLLEVQHD